MCGKNEFWQMCTQRRIEYRGKKGKYVAADRKKWCNGGSTEKDENERIDSESWNGRRKMKNGTDIKPSLSSGFMEVAIKIFLEGNSDAWQKEHRFWLQF